ncbi:caspase family protein, partial [Pseudorhodoplanes sp.]|uniref:caspase family protein n=1 Tax=Pseudorhodoplanes sp. TaxID=1934341 RepID=UPI002B6C0708
MFRRYPIVVSGATAMAALSIASTIVCAMLLSAAPAQAKRVALVIGNGAYKSVAPLDNPGNDAADVSAAFDRLGFEVLKVNDGTFDAMRRGLLDFARRARGSEIAIVFYAGHGMEVGGENYLVPVDAELKADV